MAHQTSENGRAIVSDISRVVVRIWEDTSVHGMGYLRAAGEHLPIIARSAWEKGVETVGCARVALIDALRIARRALLLEKTCAK